MKNDSVLHMGMWKTNRKGEGERNYFILTKSKDGANKKKGELNMKSLQKGKRKRVNFELSAEPGKRVFVAGTFNNWNPKANQLKDNPESGNYKATMLIPQGKHEYKFIVNDEWTLNPESQDLVPNGHGTMNNVLQV
jgi:1,4-alpha-glucan branching enzyme